MSAIDTMPDVDTTVLEDLDFDLVCTVQIESLVPLGHGWFVGGRTRPCGQPAVAELRCTVCGAAGWCCGSHRALIASSPQAHCMRCDSVAPGVTLYSFTPLGGA